jgi:drug/metabolite transporter (DMT)-like permease
MISPHLIGVFFGLASALTWGSGDLSGGVASRRSNQYRVLYMTALMGVLILAALALLRSEPVPQGMDFALAASAGICGAFGIIALYLGLSLGNAAIVMPTSAVVSVITPVIFSFFTEGLPGVLTIVGFVLAIAGVWLVSNGSESDHSEYGGHSDYGGHSSSGLAAGSRRGFWSGVLAGLGFGGYFVFISQLETAEVFSPLVVSKGAALVLSLLILAWRRERPLSLKENPTAVLAGVLDAGGNVFFLLATQFTRLDVASVLASMYAMTAVILARIMLHEAVTARQWGGVFLCTTAIALIVV